MGTNYYAELKPPCPHCGAEPISIHIGKSSFGWPFHFRRYLPERDPEVALPLYSWGSWKVFLTNRPIHDEYGKAITLEELERKIIGKRIYSNEHRVSDARAQYPTHFQRTPDGDLFSDGEFS